MTKDRHLAENLYLVIVFLLFGITLLVDYLLPHNVVISGVYILPLLLGTFLVKESKKIVPIIGLAVVCIYLGWQLKGYSFSEDWISFINRLVSVFLVIVVSFFGIAFSRSQKESKKIQRQLATAMDTSPNGIFLVNSAGNIIYANHQAEEKFEYSALEFSSMTIEDLIPKRFAGHHKALRDKYMVDPENREMGAGRELFGVSQSGREFPLEIGLASFGEGTEKIVQATVIDITERVKRTREIESKSEEIEQLVNIVAHDIQAPVRHIFGHLQAGRKGVKNDAILKTFNQIDKSAQKIRELIQGLLNFAKAGTRDLKWQTFPLASVIEDIVDLHDIEIRQKSIQVRIGELPDIRGDIALVGQLFQNLIENAMKYHHPDGHKKVKIYSTRENGVLTVWVEDNGIGIDGVFYDDIFKPLRRLHSSAEFEGSGIGLSICKKITDLHEWKIGLVSDLGKGTKFFVVIQ